MFPEKWVTWNFTVVDISECCKIHDEKCSTTKFFKCLRERNILGATLITLGGLIGCIAKYPIKMLKRT